MKVSLSWLKDYVPVATTPAETAARLTMAGLEVESLNDWYDYLANVVVSRVVAVEPHPEADKLTCCTVDVGRDAPLSIVCGAPNVREGLLVPCALPGAVLPGEFLIKKSKLRGAVSEGMLCSAAELRLSSDTAGILELDGGLVPGTPLAEALGLADPVFEIDLTPNRPDCLSAIGIAREVSVFQNPAATLQVPATGFEEMPDNGISVRDRIQVEIQDPDLCPRYTAAYIEDVTVGPSPFWLRQRLESVGLTPINNVVDVTNYVMMETGQPLHAFDYDFLAGRKIVVRRAGDERTFVTLDSKEHTLEPDMLMICDGEKSVGVAGVMGGENSEITNTTTRVLLESAYFNPVSIRRTAKVTGIGSDASHRFERGVDPEGTVYALHRAAVLIATLSGGTLAKDWVDAYPGPHEPVSIRLSVDFLNRRIGTDLDARIVQDLLTGVGFAVTTESDDLMTVGVPSFRVDVFRPEDLCEEVARIWGYNRIATRFPAVKASAGTTSPVLGFRDRVRDAMNGFGFSEAINYSFTSAQSCDLLCLADDDPRRAVEGILNPISEDLAVMRSSLLPGLLETMKRNTSKQVDAMRIFEVGKVFFARGDGIQPTEIEMLAGLWTGDRDLRNWQGKPVEVDFFDVKGVVEGLLEFLKISGVRFERADRRTMPFYRPGYAARIMADDRLIGSIGQIDARVLKNFGLKQDAVVFEFSMEELLTLAPDVIVSKPLPRFPSLSRDMTLIVDQAVTAGDVTSAIRAMMETEPLIEDVFLFDVYQGEPLPEGRKSFSFRIIYRSWEKTLKEKMIRELHATLSERLLEEFDATLPA